MLAVDLMLSCVTILSFEKTVHCYTTPNNCQTTVHLDLRLYSLGHQERDLDVANIGNKSGMNEITFGPKYRIL